MAFAPDAAQAATMSVHLVDPPVVGRQPLTVQVTVTGAAQGDGHQLYLTRGDARTPGDLKGPSPLATRRSSRMCCSNRRPTTGPRSQ
jgi:hypothetical protein